MAAVIVDRHGLAKRATRREDAPVRKALLLVAVVSVIVGAIALRSPKPTSRDPFRVAEERLQAERARGHVDAAQVESIHLALQVAHDGVDGPRYKILRGEALQSASREVSACRITDLSPWLDEPIGVAECRFSPVGR